MALGIPTPLTTHAATNMHAGSLWCCKVQARPAACRAYLLVCSWAQASHKHGQLLGGCPAGTTTPGGTPADAEKDRGG